MNPKVGQVRDEEVKIVSHHNDPLYIHVENTKVQGVHHLGVYVEGVYCPEHNSSQNNHDHHQAQSTIRIIYQHVERSVVMSASPGC
jgi:hypothetical protein